MLDFRKIDKKDISLIRPYLKTTSRICTKAIGVMYMWSDYFGTEIALAGDGVIVKDRLFGNDLFMTPRGVSAAEGFRLIEEYERQKGGDLVFNSVDEEDLKVLSARYPVIEIKSHRDYSDYLYLTSIFVLVGLLRYIQVSVVDKKSGDPTKVILRDRFTQCVLLAWVLAFLLIIYVF